MKCCSLHCNRDEASSPPVKLEIIDVEKVKGLSNYYVSPLSCRTDTELPLLLSNHPHISLQAYIIKVLCKDGRIYHIYRRYSQFDEMHSSLEKRFPIESGAIRAKDRVLPSLPGIIQWGHVVYSYSCDTAHCTCTSINNSYPFQCCLAS